jgi:hypothetical protein
MFDINLKEQIDSFSCKVPLSEIVIDWGYKQGNGKRINGMVKGAIEAPRGKHFYYSVDLSEFSSEKDIEILDSQPLGARYYKARKFGVDHKTSMHYALLIGRGK